jgi:glycosyltransferase involved in cell wall biosynthesis
LKLLRRKKQLNIPVVLELHYAGCYYDLLSPSHDKSRRGKQEKIYRKERTLLTEVSGLVMTTRSLREIVEKEFPLKCPVRVIPNGTDPPQSFRRYDFSDKKDIYYIGSLDREKGVDVALQAMKFLPESKLVIIGEGRKRAHEWLNDLARRERIESRVEFKGYLEPGKIKGIMGSARILVLPYPDTPLNRYCTSPLKLFESLASGSPIVASSLPTTREILAHEKNAYLVQPGDPRALAQGIRVLYDNPELSREIARNARSEAEKYTWDQRAGNINDFLSSVDRNNKFPPQSQRPSSRFYG